MPPLQEEETNAMANSPKKDAVYGSCLNLGGRMDGVDVHHCVTKGLLVCNSGASFLCEHYTVQSSCE